MALFAAPLSAVLRLRVGGEEAAGAASATRQLVAAPAAAALGDGADVTDLARRADALSAFLGNDVLAIRVWADSRVVAARGAEMPSASLPAASQARLEATDGTRVFAVYAREPNYTVEVDRRAAPIDDAIAAQQREILTTVAIVAFLAFVALQPIFWLSVRRWVGQHERLQYMYTRGQEIRSSLDLRDVLSQVAEDAAKLAHASYSLIVLFEEETGELMLRATYDATANAAREHQRPVDEWYLRRAVATQSIITSKQPASQYAELFGEGPSDAGQLHILCLPMLLRDRVAGAIAIARPEALSGFGGAEARLLQELADQSVMAVEQALLFAKVRSYANELELSYDTTLKVLMAALDTKDDATEGHCERVARLTVQLARQMNVAEGRLVDMERGALLHDVGKIGVPDEVLKKPKELNEMEWEAMRKHPLLAGVMVGKVGFLEGALPILLYHHERYDGAGYPFGLVRDKIPLDARIFAVVDSYDAMTSDRPYRKAMPHEVAMEEIAVNSGTQFDPEVVAAFEVLMAAKPHLQARMPHSISSEHIDHDEFAPRSGAEDPAA